MLWEMGRGGRFFVCALVALLLLPLAGAEATAPGANDNLANATDLGNSTSAADFGSVSNATSEPGENGYPTTHSVWVKWAAPSNAGVTVSMCNGSVQFDTFLEVFSGPATNPTFGNITSIASDDNGCGGQLSRVKFTATAGQAYYIAIVDLDQGTAGITYEVELGTAPSNDDFPGATLTSVLPVAATANNGNASKEPNEPNHAGDPGGASLWWSWQAPSSGDVVVDTCGGDFDTLLAVYTGGAFNGVTQTAADDNGCSIQQSKLKFAAVAGTVYRIAVDGKDNVVSGGPATGNIQLHLGPAAANDDLADATALTGLPVATTGDNTYSTHETSENAHAGIVGLGSIWYRWTAPSNGSAIVDTCGSSVNTQLGVYADGNTFPLTEIASNNGACGNGSRVAAFSVTNGTVYAIAIDGSGGPVVLNISDATIPTTSIDSTVIKRRRHKATFTFSGAGGAGPLTFECKFDHGSFAPCQSPFVKRRLKRGLHTFSVRATDGVNTDASPATVTFRIRH